MECAKATFAGTSSRSSQLAAASSAYPDSTCSWYSAKTRSHRPYSEQGRMKRFRANCGSLAAGIRLSPGGFGPASVGAMGSGHLGISNQRSFPSMRFRMADISRHCWVIYA